MATAPKLTPEQEKLFVVNEDALAAATQSMIGASHPNNVAMVRHAIEHYLAAVKAGLEALPPPAGREGETRDQRNAREERESAERIRKAAEPKNKVPEGITGHKPGPGR